MVIFILKETLFTLIAPLPCREAVFHREGFLSLQHFVL